MAFTAKPVYLVLQGNTGFDTEYEDLQEALDRADFLSQPEHSGFDHAYVLTAVTRVDQTS